MQTSVIDSAAKAEQCQAITKDGKGPQCSKAAKTDGLCTQHIKMGNKAQRISQPQGILHAQLRLTMPSMWDDSLDADFLLLTTRWPHAGRDQQAQRSVTDTAAKAGQCQAITKDGKGPQCFKAAKTDGLCTQHFKMGDKAQLISEPQGGLCAKHVERHCWCQ